MSLTTDLQCIAEDDTSHYPAAAKVACASAAADVERLTAENERMAAGREAAIRTLADSRFPPVTRINDAIAILSRSGIVQQKTVNSEEGK